MSERQTLVSVDLDDLACYHAIHGLGPVPDGRHGVVLERCLPRFLELFAELGVTATFFVVGRDLERDLATGGRGAESLGLALAEGHELANHGHAHAYDLVRRSDEHIARDLRACDGLLRGLGADVQGFRAPGYTHDDRLLGHVAGLGYRYDSSALPSLSYYLAKVFVMGLMVLRGRRSASTAHGIGAFLGRRRPYFRARVRLWEVPISVTDVLRIPLIGTFLLGGPDWLRRGLARAAERAAYLHVELHGLDLADADGDGVDDRLRSRQPGLGLPLAIRRDRLRALLGQRGSGCSIAAALPRAPLDASSA
jgi:hypothetical protein